MFDYISWPETMVGNRNQLAKADKDDILNKLNAKQHVSRDDKPFGDGHASEHIVKLISEFKA